MTKHPSSQHDHCHTLAHEHISHPKGKILTIRSHSGLSGDMMLAGLLCMTSLPQEKLDALLVTIMPEFAHSISLIRKDVHGIGGWHAHVELPKQHEHRTLEDILALVANSGMEEAAKILAAQTFTLLAQAESRVHGIPQEQVHFHEVGALDSILDICMNCALFHEISPTHFIVSPLPIADGSVHCAHGVLPAPAPAVLELLDGVPVRSFDGAGETVTPTALALLKSFGAEFGGWPDMIIEKHAIVYGTHTFEGVPNGAFFALGEHG